MSDHWSRVAELVGVPPAPNGGVLPDSFERIVIVAVVALVCAALVATWRAAERPARASLERYGVVCVVLTGAGLAWPAAFYYHYAAFLAPFLALPFGVAAEALSKTKGWAIALASACALIVVGSAHAVRAVQTVDQPNLADVAYVDRTIPAGSCTVSDNPAVLVLADRFSVPAGCSDLVDADGSTLVWSGGKPGANALSTPAALVDWVRVFEQADYLLLTGGLTPGRIPGARPCSATCTPTSAWPATPVGSLCGLASHSHYVGLVRASFLAGYPFELDGFQLEAMDALDRGHNVVVAAPTGSGKTVVAEYAVARAIDEGAKAFYTTPLKALSNQKFADFTRRYGSAKVGLLTGDNSVNGDAPVVVMTTEVLRNMIYAGSSTLAGLRYVILDEVHYLQNAYRGPVWEEVIIHLPPEVDLVCLSATVSNAEELADWVGTVRGSTTAVIEERRPVALHNLYLVGERRSERLLLLPDLRRRAPEPSRRRPYLQRRSRLAGAAPGRLVRAPARRDRGTAGRRGPAAGDLFHLQPGGLRRGGRASACARAAGSPPPEQRRQIRAIAEAAASNLSDADLVALGYGNWLAGLEAGFAAHHAGLVPPFKEAVERCFLAGLVKVVFATETLSLGINMPARSVVIEKLSKFSGERVELLTPGEYTQLTGRRRAPRHRRGGLRRGVVVARCHFRPGGLAGRGTQLRARPRASARPTTWRPTWSGAPLLNRRTICSTCPLRSTGPTATWSASNAPWNAPARSSPSRPRRRRVSSATCPSTGGAPNRPPMAAALTAKPPAPAPGRSLRPWRACAQATSCWCRPVSPAGRGRTKRWPCFLRASEKRATSACAPSPPAAG